MRVDDTHRTVEETAANLSRLMDDFASVSLHASGAIGGYRVMHAPRPASRPKRMPPPPARSIRRSRIRMTSTVAALLVSSLGVAAFSGPAACPTCDGPVTTATLAASGEQHMTRLAYARPALTDGASRIPLGTTDLASLEPRGLPEARAPRSLETVELADTSEPVDASPISTSAIEPAPHDGAAQRLVLDNTRGGLLPARSVELADTAPKPIRLAAASPVEVMPASIPEIEARTVTLSGLARQADEPETFAEPEPKPEHVAESHSARKHTSSKRRAYRAYRSVTETHEAKRKRLANVPPWAEKMFAPVWQSKAFNY